MAYVANIVTVVEMQLYAGEDIDTTGDADAHHTILQDHAEGYLSALLDYELSAANWALLTATVKSLITEWAARYAATVLIAYKFTGEAAALTRIEAEDRINVHAWRMEKIENLLLQPGALKILGGAR